MLRRNANAHVHQDPFTASQRLPLRCWSSAGAMAQQTPGPNDEAQLYELAKKEGKVVWYESAPLEPMQAIALAFEKKYPGIKVEVLRIVGVQQYQRFMQEVQSKRHNVDVLHISDQPSMLALIEEGHIADWKVPTHDRYPESFRLKHPRLCELLDRQRDHLQRQQGDAGRGEAARVRLEGGARSALQGSLRGHQHEVRRLLCGDPHVRGSQVQGSLRNRIPQADRRAEAGGLFRGAGRARPRDRRRARLHLLDLGRHRARPNGSRARRSAGCIPSRRRPSAIPGRRCRNTRRARTPRGCSRTGR